MADHLVLLKDVDPQRGSTTASWPSALVAPLSLDEFLSAHWLKRHLLAGGAAERFSGLLSWTAFNEILEHHWREANRFRLACQGRDLDPSSYADLRGGAPRIRARDVTDHLRRGATLSFDGLDELHEPLRRLAVSFEATFRGATQVNVYAGFGALHGLDPHCDDEEVFILQVDGRKRWLLYGDSMDGAGRGRPMGGSAPPPGAMLDRILEPGDLLYIPRGRYHVAVPMNEPTLHLTVGVKSPRGVDLLRWMTDRVRASDMADRDLPGHGGAAERLRFSEELRGALLNGLDADLVAQYFSEAGANFRRRPSFSLPWSAVPDRLPPGSDFLVRLIVPSSLVANGDAESEAIELQCAGRRCRFPRSMRWVVEALDEGTPRPFNRLIEAVAGRLDEQMLRTLVGMLLKEGLVAIRV